MDAELVYADSVSRALALLSRESFDGVYADTSDMTLLRQAGTLLQADRVLETLADGVAIVDPDMRIVWANAEFERWCSGPVDGKSFYEALSSPEILGPDYSPFHTALTHGPIFTRLHAPGGRYLQLHVTPVRSPQGAVTHFICLGRDITRECQQQQKLDAIHQAGRELAALAPDELAVMTVQERVELLKSNILRYTHDLLHYHVVEIRLLDHVTGRLEPLLSEGITPEAAHRELFGAAKGNGITGFVAATGKSYLCPDTANDPLYIEGAAGAKSSLTVPLIYQDRVIGTFNVESPQVGAFTEQDQQFLEIFSREIADAVHTLELLVAEKRSTATQSVEAIRREVAMPVDEILTSATALLARYIGHDQAMADQLRHILGNARAIKQCIEKVGETLAPTVRERQQPERPQPKLRGLRLLVADQDDRVRRSAHSTLGRFGCVVETARSGKEALLMAEMNPYDAILADIRLPDMTGYDFFHQVRRTRPQAQVVFMNAYGYDASHSVVKARQEGGLLGVLFKPFRVDQLLDVLAKLAPASRDAAPVPAPAEV
jgi:CheY-like chemotaxis protein/GAF domain-containing protein